MLALLAFFRVRIRTEVRTRVSSARALAGRVARRWAANQVRRERLAGLVLEPAQSASTIRAWLGHSVRILALLVVLLPWPVLAADSQCVVCANPSFGPLARAFSTRFPGEQSYYVGTAKFVAVGDFNNDGIPDLAVDGGGLEIFLGFGGGSYAPPVWLPFSDPRWIATGDFNGDGNLDLAIASTGVLYILLGDGTGAFPRVSFGPYYGVERIAAGDFNGDGILDLATVDYHGNRLSIFRGAGDGTFSLAQSLLIGSSDAFYDLAPRAADLNGDGIDDLAVAASGDGVVAILLGHATGGMTISYVPGFTQAAGDLRIGDFNNDGIPDLVVESSTGPQSLTVLEGNGDGSFRALPPFTVGYTIRFTVGDFNGDGKLDIALWRFCGDQFCGNQGIFVYPGLGDGSFGAPVRTAMATSGSPRGSRPEVCWG